MNDFLEALKNTKPSVGINVIERYENWENEFSNK